jgi:hypothetical protein
MGNESAFVVKILCATFAVVCTAGWFCRFLGLSVTSAAAVMVLSLLLKCAKKQASVHASFPACSLADLRYRVRAAPLCCFWQPCIYCALLCVRADFSPIYTGVSELFKASSIALLLFVPFTVLIGHAARLEQLVLPYLLSFLSCGVLLLRILRREEQVNRQWRLMLLDAVSVILCLAAAVFFSSKAFLQALGTFFSGMYQNVVAPLIMGVAYVFTGLAWLIWRAVSLVGGKSAADSREVQMEIGDFNFHTFKIAQSGDGWLLWKILLALAIIAFALLSAMLFKRLMAGYGAARRKSASLPEIREKIPAGASQPAGRSPLVPLNSRDIVRWYYRKFLKRAVAGGLTISPGDTSESIARAAGSLFDPLLLRELRELYIVARYSPAVITRDDALRARAIYGRLKSKSE